MRPINPDLLSQISHLTPLTDTQASTWSLVFTASYVGSIYLVNLVQPFRASRVAVNGKGKDVNTSGDVGIPPISATDQDGRTSIEGDKEGPKVGDRDHPVTIKTRITAVSVATGLAVGSVVVIVARQGNTRVLDAISPSLQLLGISPDYIQSILRGIASFTFKSLEKVFLPYLLAPAMLFGPLYAMWLDRDLPFQGPSPGSLWKRFRRFRQAWGWVEWRNYVAGPITEELVFRSALIAPAILAKQSARWIVFGTPLYFGIAHAHHALQVYRKRREEGATVGHALIPAILGSVFQLTYTSLFGFFASYLYIRTGSVIPSTFSHVFCNMMGIYMPMTAVARHPSRSKSIWLAYLGGIAGFVWGIRRL